MSEGMTRKIGYSELRRFAREETLAGAAARLALRAWDYRVALFFIAVVPFVLLLYKFTGLRLQGYHYYFYVDNYDPTLDVFVMQTVAGTAIFVFFILAMLISVFLVASKLTIRISQSEREGFLKASYTQPTNTEPIFVSQQPDEDRETSFLEIRKPKNARSKMKNRRKLPESNFRTEIFAALFSARPVFLPNFQKATKENDYRLLLTAWDTACKAFEKDRRKKEIDPVKQRELKRIVIYIGSGLYLAAFILTLNTNFICFLFGLIISSIYYYNSVATKGRTLPDVAVSLVAVTLVFWIFSLYPTTLAATLILTVLWTAGCAIGIRYLNSRLSVVETLANDLLIDEYGRSSDLLNINGEYVALSASTQLQHK